MVQTAHVASTLHPRIMKAIRDNKADLPFIRKNPLTDFFSVRERRDVTIRTIRQEFKELMTDAKNKTRIVSPSDLRIMRPRLQQLVLYKAACLEVIGQFLKMSRWAEHQQSAAVLVEALRLIPSPTAKKLLRRAVNNVNDPKVREKAERLAK